MENEEDPELIALRKKRAEKLNEELKTIDEKKGWPGRPVIVTDDNFRQMVSRYPNLVIDLWAPWCSPCKMLTPIIENLAGKYQGKVVFGKLNIDENSKTAQTFKVMSIPTILFIKNMELVERVTGAVPMRVLEQHIEKHMGV